MDSLPGIEALCMKIRAGRDVSGLCVATDRYLHQFTVYEPEPDAEYTRVRYVPEVPA